MVIDTVSPVVLWSEVDTVSPVVLWSEVDTAHAAECLPLLLTR